MKKTIINYFRRKQKTRSFVLEIILKLSALARLHSVSILLDKYGNFRSYRNWQCVDKDGVPIPWFTYPAIEYLKQLDWREKSVFEYGSGNSSLFFAKRVKNLISVEDDLKWFEANKNKLSANQTIIFADKAIDYIHAIEKSKNTFDLIIIDGSHRPECTKLALKYLNSNGCILFDNSDWYPNTCAFLRTQDLIQIDFHGFGPINQYTWTTSLFLMRSFNSTTLGNRQPMPSISAIHHTFD